MKELVRTAKALGKSDGFDAYNDDDLDLEMFDDGLDSFLNQIAPMRFESLVLQNAYKRGFTEAWDQSAAVKHRLGALADPTAHGYISYEQIAKRT